jgi:hypothetical protein
MFQPQQPTEPISGTERYTYSVLANKNNLMKKLKILKMYLKVKYCEVNKESNLHIKNGTSNPCKLPK